jgi:uncharacterized protein (UPF0276 family)
MSGKLVRQHLQALPELGIGMVYFPSLEPLLEAGGNLIQVLEVEPQPYWIKEGGSFPAYRLDEQAFKHMLQWPQRKILHGVGMPVGGSLGLDDSQMEPFLHSVATLEPVWVSEHLAFLRAANLMGPYPTGFLLPPLQSPATLKMAVQNIRQFQSMLGIPFAFENGPNYLRPVSGEMPDGEFLAGIAEQADCGMLLDMHNLWCNHLNGRQPIHEVLASIPLERVCEIHLAGGDNYQGYWLDAHSGIIPEELMEICFEWIPQLPNLKAIIFEIIPDYVAAKAISIDSLLGQFQQLQALWESRGSNVSENRNYRINAIPAKEPDDLPKPCDWENALGSLVNRRMPQNDLQAKLSGDPGIGVLQHLVTSVRAGMLVDLLTLSYRLMVLHLGDAAVLALMQDYWKQTFPEPFAAEEAQRFANFIRQRELLVPHLDEVLAYEIASIESLKTGQETVVDFSCCPITLLEALRVGKLPNQLPAGRYEVVVQP